MNNDQAKLLINNKINDCKKEHLKEKTLTITNTSLSIVSMETISILLANYVKDIKVLSYPMYFMGIILGYALVTLDGALSLQYSKKDYLEFLKKVKLDLENNKNIFESIEEEEEFNKQLQKIYNSKKELKF